MHELSVAENILEIVRETLDANGGGTVRSVKICVGELAGIVPESLKFAFDAIKAGTFLEGAKLEIEKKPIVVHCENCGGESSIERFLFKCPQCASENLEIISGNELQVMEIEVDDKGVSA
jgi:hydrogenase nickel incorporation protein HypA/HybF